MREPFKGGRAVVILLAALLALPMAFGNSPAVGAPDDPTQIALDYVHEHAAEWGLTADDVAEIRVTDTYESAHNRVTHVYLRQQSGGIDVARANMTVNIDREGKILFVGNRFVTLPPPTGPAALTAPDAASSAAAELGLETTKDIRLLESPRGVQRRTELSNGGVSTRAIPAKLVYELVDGNLRLAWNLSIEELGGAHYWDASVDAETGELLAKVDLVNHDEVQATAAAVAPASAATVATTRSAAAQQETKKATYRVFELPLESPLDGPRTLVSDPSTKSGSPFGWHDTDGADGAEYTVTRGNNVHVYTDHDDNGMPDPGKRSGRWYGAEVRLPDRLHPTSTRVFGCGRYEPLLLEQHHSRRLLQLRFHRGGWELPSQQLRQWRAAE